MDFNSNYNSREEEANLILEIARKVVAKYVHRTVIPWRESEDVMMSIVEKFLNQKEKIDGAFEGKAQLSTYYIAVVNRMCCEVIRKESKHWYTVSNEPDEGKRVDVLTTSIEAEKKVAMANELKRLNNAMLFFNGERAKVNLFMKYYFEIPVKHEDIAAYSKDNVEKLYGYFEQNESTSKGIMFDRLAQVVNHAEGKDIKSDAVRMWLNKQIDTILCRLNGNGISNHDKESLAILFEMQDEARSFSNGNIDKMAFILFLISLTLW